MRRQSLSLALALLVALILVIHSYASPLSQSTQVQITSPEIGSRVRGRVPVLGSASVPDFQFFKVEFGAGPNPSQWAVLGVLHYEPVINGQLEVWDTTVVPDGVYTLRVQGVKNDGNWEEFLVRGITVANSEPTPTETPEASATPLVTDTPAARYTATPRPTATLQIIAPTAALSVPTATPTLSRPVRNSALPIDPESWLESLAFGAAAMGIVFVVLGIVFGVRRLL